MHARGRSGIRARAAAPLAILGAVWTLGACRTSYALAPPVVPRSATVAAALGPEVDTSTMDRKLLFGYQGWFGCPDDGSPLGRWEHWFRRGAPASAATVRVDLWPDVSELDDDERCRTPLRHADGSSAAVYSAYNPKTVERHFRWMKEYALAGVFLQRFVAGLAAADLRGFRDAVLHNVRVGAERHGRVFALMYDISGQPREGLVEALERDWKYLVDTLEITRSPRYLHHRGRPVLAIWGFGFTDRSATPEQAAELIEFFKSHEDPRYRVTLVGGVPSRWRSRNRDSLRDRRWERVYRSFDVLSPWTVGRFRDNATADRFYRKEIGQDLEKTRSLSIEYLPVIFPGFSWHNLKGQPPLNQIPRRGGRFYWRQVQNALRAGCTMLYGAMFDEVDEGTAIYKLAARAAQAPADAAFVTLDADREDVPNDWYLRLAGEAQRLLQGEPLPAAELPFALPGTPRPRRRRSSRLSRPPGRAPRSR